jgi:hypothetical protein
VSKPIRKSIQPTYDIRKTGPRYYVTTTVDDRVIGKFMQPISDPFVHQTVRISWRDLLRAALRCREIKIDVVVGGDKDIVDDVLELDGDCLVPNSTRRLQFNKALNARMSDFASGTDDSEATHG